MYQHAEDLAATTIDVKAPANVQREQLKAMHLGRAAVAEMRPVLFPED